MHAAGCGQARKKHGAGSPAARGTSADIYRNPFQGDKNTDSRLNGLRPLIVKIQQFIRCYGLACLMLNRIAVATHGLSGRHRVSDGSVATGGQAADVPILLVRSSGDDEYEVKE